MMNHPPRLFSASLILIAVNACSDGEKEVLSNTNGGSPGSTASSGGGGGSPIGASGGSATTGGAPSGSGGSSRGRGGGPIGASGGSATTGGAPSGSGGSSGGRTAVELPPEDKPWVQLGEALSAPRTRVQDPTLGIDGNGRPAVAWTQEQTIQAAVYEGPSWTEQQQVYDESGGRPNQLPSMAVDPNGIVHVALQRLAPSKSTIVVRRLSGNSWQSVGSEQPGVDPDLTFDRDVPVISYADQLGTDEVSVARLGDSNWNVLGDALGPSADSSSSVAAHGGGIVVGRAPSAAVVASWNGSAWEAVGDSLGSNVSGLRNSGTQVALTASGEVVAAWATEGAGVSVARWSGSQWTILGEPFAGLRPALALSSSRVPFVASGHDGNVQVRWWDEQNDTWVSAQDALDEDGIIDSWDLVVDPDGLPVVAYAAPSGVFRDIIVVRLER